MLTEIRLKNFKCFREETAFPLAKINLLTGINGRGKSTLLQSLLLMKQSVEHNEYTNELILNGNCVNLGSFEDIKNNLATSEENVEIYFDYTNIVNYTNKIRYYIKQELINKIDIDFTVRISDDEYNYKDILLRIEPPEYYRRELCFIGKLLLGTSDEEIEGNNLGYDGLKYIIYSYIELKNLLPKINDLYTDIHDDIDGQYKENKNPVYWYVDIQDSNFHNQIHYISADRLGSQEYYKRITLPKFIHVDKKGENVATVLSFFNKKLDFLVNDNLYLGNDAKNLIRQTGEWLSKIFDTQIEVKIEDTSPFIIPLTFLMNPKEYKPTNVGFGYSYILPIIVSGLIAKKDEILIIENPEAHLHPKAQSELTKFLAKVASGGVQVFIESHSEHILNGLRIATIEANENDKILEKEDVNILYFDNSETYFKQIKIMEDNDLSLWAKDFFDQTNNDYKTIYGY